MKQLKKKIQSEAGNSLLLSITAVLLLSTLSVVTFSVVVTNNRVTVYNLTTSKAIWLSQVGVE
jgi:hypothetical protein